MTFWQRVFGKKEAAPRSVLALSGPNYAVSSPRDYKSFSEEGYKKNVIAFRCIQLVANSVAMLPYMLFEKQRNGLKKEVTDSPILKLLNRPNPMQARSAFLQDWASYFQIAGNSFVLAVGNSKKIPTELYLLPPQQMKITPGDGCMPSNYIWTKQYGSEEKFIVDVMGRSAVMHTKTFNPTDKWWGMSHVEAAANGIDQHNSGGLWNLSLLQNSARPCGALVFDKDVSLNEDQLKNIKGEIDQKWTGVMNSGKPVILQGGIDYKEMSFNPKDMDFITSKKVTAVDIANAFGVPPQLIGVEGSQTFANFEQAMEFFYVYTVLPIGELLRDELNRWLVPNFSETQMIDFDKDKIEALASRREKLFDRAAKSTWLSENEKRELTGYEKYKSGTTEPGDMLFIGSGQIPIDFAAEGMAPDSESDEAEGDFQNEDDNTDDEKPVEDQETDDEESYSEDEETEKAVGSFFNFVDKKAFNVRTRAGKRAYWLSQQRRRHSFEKSFEVQLKAHFKSERKDMVAALDGVDPSLFEYVVGSVVEGNEPQLKRIIETNVRKITTSFGKDVFDMLKNFNPALEQKDSRQTYFDSAVDQYIKNEVGRRIKNISGTTRKRIINTLRKEMSASTEAGESLELLATRIQESIGAKYDSFAGSRAHVIARTETHNAATQATFKAAEALDVPNLQKEWVWSAKGQEGARADTHGEVDGVSIEMHEQFQVPKSDGTGYDFMDRPGDPDAPADQVINCGCVLVFNAPIS